MKIYNIIYEHKHGSDAIPCATPGAAYQQIRELVEENLDEIIDNEHLGVVTELLQKNSESELLNYWYLATGGRESFDIRQNVLVKEKLAPCKNCKSTNVIPYFDLSEEIHRLDAAYVWCRGCRSHGPKCSSLDEAEELWNRNKQPVDNIL